MLLFESDLLGELDRKLVFTVDSLLLDSKTASNKSASFSAFTSFVSCEPYTFNDSSPNFLNHKIANHPY